jgi:hypothetical protein
MEPQQAETRVIRVICEVKVEADAMEWAAGQIARWINHDISRGMAEGWILGANVWAGKGQSDA